jgi:hypothetical protein
VPRALAAFSAALVALLVAAGCGGAEEAGSAGAGASIAPASALAYVSVNTDPESAEWDQVDALLARFPGGQGVVDDLLQGLGEDDVDLERDVLPALGPETVAVFLKGREDPVVLVQPADEAKLGALLERSDDPPVRAEVEGWTAIAQTQADLDAFERARDAGSLDDEQAFRDAMADLAEDGLVRAYVSGGALEQALQSQGGAGGLGSMGSMLPVGGALDYLGLVLTAEDGGVRVEGRAKGSQEDLAAGGAYTPTLLERVPDDAFFVVSGKAGEIDLSQLEQNPQLGGTLGQLQTFLGVEPEELAGLFEGEVALYARGGAPIPEVTLLVAGADRQDLDVLDQLAQKLAPLAQGKLGEETLDGVDVRSFEIQGVKVFYGLDGDVLVLTIGRTAFGDLDAEDRLEGDPEFRRAADAAGLGTETSGLVYLNFADLLPLIEGFADLGGEALPEDVAGNLRPLGSFLGHAERDGETFGFTGFLEVK